MQNFWIEEKKLLSFSIAYNDKNTHYIKCVVWGKLRESLNEYLVKGQGIFLKGSLQYSSWKNKDGNKKHDYEMNVCQIKLCDTKKKEDK